MKKSFIIRSLAVTAVTAHLFVLPVSASVDPALKTASAQSLVRLEIMKGDANGNLALENEVKRCEFVTLAIRMLGYDKDTDLSRISLPFKDITHQHWAYDFIKIGLKYKLIQGLPDNRVAPDSNVTYAEALTVLIRGLGYESTLTGQWPDSVLNKAQELGLTKNISLPRDKQLTRGEVAVLINNSLTIEYKK